MIVWTLGQAALVAGLVLACSVLVLAWVIRPLSVKACDALVGLGLLFIASGILAALVAWNEPL